MDELDISTLPREQVRARLVGVPQDAFLIDGISVRLNADPAGLLDDAAIEDSLRAVELWDIVAEKGGLGVPMWLGMVVIDVTQRERKAPPTRIVRVCVRINEMAEKNRV